MATSAEAGELALPDGFSVTVFADNVGRARHIAVSDAGVVYVALRTGELVALKDTDGDGEADERARRAAPVHTGVRIHDGWLYVADTVSVSRIKLSGAMLPEGEFQTVVSGFPAQRQHAAKTMAFDDAGGLYVNVGAPANACQEKMRTPGSKGQRPCPLLETHGGVWRFEADRPGQTQADGTRYVTGLRHAVALEWNRAANALYLVQHGRDQLSGLWPDLYTDKQSAELPAEEFHKIESGADLGWPYTYYDQFRKARMLAPEYGGDGKTVSDQGQAPLYAFPGHWAPNALSFYRGDAFPEKYRGAALIAFHGSWNRAPEPQEGYRVQVLPMKDGKPAGPAEDFATGFAGEDPLGSPGDAAHRPTGLAEGPDGAVYIADSVKGRIWRVTYSGGGQ